jgi:hypothetical protein
MGKLLRQCYRQAVAKALKVYRSDTIGKPRQKNRPKSCRSRSSHGDGTRTAARLCRDGVGIETMLKRVPRQDMAWQIDFFLIWVRRVLRKLVAVYVALFFYSFPFLLN